MSHLTMIFMLFGNLQQWTMFNYWLCPQAMIMSILTAKDVNNEIPISMPCYISYTIWFLYQIKWLLPSFSTSHHTWCYTTWEALSISVNSNRSVVSLDKRYTWMKQLTSYEHNVIFSCVMPNCWFFIVRF
jgi:hypothetical protein